MGGIKITIRDRYGKVMETIQLVEDSEHVLLPSATGSAVMGLIATHQGRSPPWRYVDVEVL